MLSSGKGWSHILKVPRNWLSQLGKTFCWGFKKWKEMALLYKCYSCCFPFLLYFCFFSLWSLTCLQKRRLRKRFYYQLRRNMFIAIKLKIYIDPYFGRVCNLVVMIDLKSFMDSLRSISNSRSSAFQTYSFYALHHKGGCYKEDPLGRPSNS